MTTLALKTKSRYSANTQVPQFISSLISSQPVGMSKDLQVVTILSGDIINHYYFPLSRTTEAIFEDLANIWYDNTGVMSTVAEMIIHPAYKAIINMGTSVIPCILREIEKNPQHWFWALREITGIDPTKPQQQGKVKEMANAWINWGMEQGYK